ncbi:hypothetical protein LXL04_018106 [Taraxacum kok-saghyz]
MAIDGKAVCKLCHASSEDMKSLLNHMNSHLDADWKTFVRTPIPTTPTVDNKAKVVDSKELRSRYVGGS